MLARLLQMRMRAPEARRVVDGALQRATGLDRLRLLMERALIEVLEGRSSDACDAATRELADDVDRLPGAPMHLRAEVLSIVGVNEVAMGRIDTALPMAERAVALADRSGEVRSSVETRLRLAYAYLVTDNRPATLSTLEEARRRASQHALPLLEARCRTYAIDTIRPVGRLSAARDEVEACLRLCPEDANLSIHVQLKHKAAAIARCEGRLGDAHAVIADLLRLQHPHVYEGVALDTALSAALNHKYAGRVDLAIAAMAPGIEDGRIERQAPYFRDWHLLCYCELLWLAGRDREADELFRRFDNDGTSAKVLLLSSLRALRQGRRSECIDGMTHALRIVGTGNESARIRLSLAWLLVEDGHIRRADALLDELEALGSELPELALVRYAAAVRRGEVTLDEREWRRRVRAVTMVAHTYPWLADASAAHRLVAGHPRRLPEFIAAD